jgi:hypothetical protein
MIVSEQNSKLAVVFRYTTQLFLHCSDFDSTTCNLIPQLRILTGVENKILRYTVRPPPTINRINMQDKNAEDVCSKADIGKFLKKISKVRSSH